MRMRRERIATGAPDAEAKPSTLTKATDAAKPAEAGAASERPEPQGGGVEAALAPLRVLLERGDEQGARRLVGELLKQWPDSPRLQHLSRILAPPTLRARPDVKPVSRDRERAWLGAHAHEYPGCWLAVLGDELVAADPALKVVLARMKQDPAFGDAILYFAGRNTE
jgi:hypothetical protein